MPFPIASTVVSHYSYKFQLDAMMKKQQEAADFARGGGGANPEGAAGGSVAVRCFSCDQYTEQAARTSVRNRAQHTKLRNHLPALIEMKDASNKPPLSPAVASIQGAGGSGTVSPLLGRSMNIKDKTSADTSTGTDAQFGLSPSPPLSKWAEPADDEAWSTYGSFVAPSPATSSSASATSHRGGGMPSLIVPVVSNAAPSSPYQQSSTMTVSSASHAAAAAESTTTNFSNLPLVRTNQGQRATDTAGKQLPQYMLPTTTSASPATGNKSSVKARPIHVSPLMGRSMRASSATTSSPGGATTNTRRPCSPPKLSDQAAYSGVDVVPMVKGVCTRPSTTPPRSSAVLTTIQQAESLECRGGAATLGVVPSTSGRQSQSQQQQQP